MALVDCLLSCFSIILLFSSFLCEIDHIRLTRLVTNVAPAIGPEAACDESNRPRSCGAADTRSLALFKSVKQGSKMLVVRHQFFGEGSYLFRGQVLYRQSPWKMRLVDGYIDHERHVLHLQVQISFQFSTKSLVVILTVKSVYAQGKFLLPGTPAILHAKSPCRWIFLIHVILKLHLLQSSPEK